MTEGQQLSSRDCFPFCISGGRGELEGILDNISRAPAFWLIRHMSQVWNFPLAVGVTSVLQMFTVLYFGLRGAQSECASMQVILPQRILLSPFVIICKQSSQDGPVFSSLLASIPEKGINRIALSKAPSLESKRGYIVSHHGLGYCFTGVKRHHGQGNLAKESI